MNGRDLVFIDSNLLIYSTYGSKNKAEIVDGIRNDSKLFPVISIQVLKEFANVCLKKNFCSTRAELIRHIEHFTQAFFVSDITAKTIVSAIDIHGMYQYSFYDSLIIATALEQGCETLYSEDLQHGQIIKRKLKIVNPFV